jgi:hypothetical protein
MFCPSDVNTGLIQLVGPISTPDLKTITVDHAPLRVSFGPRSTAPSLIGNRIDDISQNTCTYHHTKFTLVDIQIVSPIHTGYNLPGNTDTPQAEFVLSFSSNSPASSLATPSGVLICFPIHVSNPASHDAYLDMVIQHDSTVAVVPTLESIFYEQTSFGYRTCFETVDGEHTVHSNSLFINVYPNGIHLSPSTYQQLFSLLQQQLPTYQVPPGLRGGDATVRSYQMDDDGNKTPTRIDTDGVMYFSPLSTCTDDFKNRFEYFTKAVSSMAGSNTSSKVGGSGSCPTVKQYKCVPFDQLRDANGGYVKVSDGTCLDDMIKNGTLPSSSDSSDNTEKSSTSTGLSVAQIEELVGGIAAGVVLIGIGLYVASKLSKD